MSDILSILRKTTLLGAASDENLSAMAAKARELKFEKGEFLFKKGDPSDTLHVIIKGRVRVVDQTEEGEVTFAVLDEGQTIGEMGLIDDLPRSAGVRAASATVEVLEVPRDVVLDTLMSDRNVFQETLKTISLRLRSSNQELEKRFAELAVTNRKLGESYSATVLALSHALELRDKVTGGHSERVTAYSLIMGKQMGLSNTELEKLRLGALLHDLGKIGVSDTILHKEGKLTDEEWEKMREHPTLGKKIVEGVEFLEGAVDVVWGHHEKWNGKGYPQGLKEEEIPVGARIFAIADVYDALTMSRPYKDAWPAERAKKIIIEDTGTHFAPDASKAFQETYEELHAVLEKSRAGESLTHYIAPITEEDEE